MLKLMFALRHQSITITNPGVVVATDSRNYLVAKFNEISTDWDKPLNAIFTHNKDKIAYTVIVGQTDELAADECYVPWEVLQNTGDVYVSVFCGDLHTTNTAKFNVVKSGYTEGEIPPPPTPTIYEQILQALESKQPMLTAGQNITITEENVISASSGSDDYTELENKPSINDVILLGNKTSDDLNLQDKLTAGENITISEEGVISATGGTDDYEDLTDKPQINGVTLSGNKSATDLELREIFFGTSNPPAVSSTKYPLYALWVNLYENTLFVLTATNGSWCNWERFNHRIIQSTEPVQEYSEINVEYQYDNGDLWLQVDSEKIIKISVCMGKHKEFLNSRTWKYFYDWADYSSSATIVSGVVNANGTITFTDSDGNTFTTTGASVIGADGFSPVATVTPTASGATVSITDKNGTTTANISNGAPGQDYVLTEQDKSEIADIVLGELPTTEGVLYGNTSN